MEVVAKEVLGRVGTGYDFEEVHEVYEDMGLAAADAVVAAVVVRNHPQGNRRMVSIQPVAEIAACEEGMGSVDCLRSLGKRTWRVPVDCRRLIEGGGCRDLTMEVRFLLTECGSVDRSVDIGVVVAGMVALDLRM